MVARTVKQHDPVCGGSLQGTFPVDFPARFEDIEPLMNPAVGFLFPGQGSQSVGMGKALFEAHSELRQIYAEATEVLGYDIAELCFNGPAETLNLTEHTQPALLVSSVAALRVLEPAGII